MQPVEEACLMARGFCGRELLVQRKALRVVQMQDDDKRWARCVRQDGRGM